jgi:diguanylate cyclase (GGDEF)-like protein
MANFQLKKFLAPTDILPITIVIGGLLLAIFMDLTAFRLIGIGVSIIGIISLFMIISQRMGEYVDTRYKSKTPPPNFNITTKKDTNAKRQTFEDFANSMKEEDKKELKDVDNSSYGDDGFKIISKKVISDKTEQQEDKNQNITENKQVNKTIAKDGEAKIVVKLEQSKMVFGEDDDLPEVPANYNPIVKNIIDKKTLEKSSDDVLSSNQPTEQIKDSTAKDKVISSVEIQNIEEMPVVAKEKQIQKQTRKIEGLSAEFLKQDPVDNLSDPKHEFEYCINRILNAIKSVGSIGTTALFMVNHQNNRYKLDSFSTNFPNDKITEKKKFDFGNDIISQIIKNSKPEILSEINPNSETELITYYNDKVGISSFIGVPIYYREEIIGVLTADSENADGFDASTVNYFSHFTRLIAILLHNYVEKYDLSQSKITLDALSKFRITDYNYNDNNLVADFFASVINLLDFSFGGIVSYSNDTWQVEHYVPDNSNVVNSINVVDNSLIANAISSKKPIYKKKLDSNEFLINNDENLPQFKKIAIIPIQSRGVCFSVVFIGTNRNEELNDNDLELLELICDYAGSAFDKMNLIFELDDLAHINSKTGLLNSKAYLHRINEEFLRAKEYGRELSLCIINIDDYEAYKDDKYQEKQYLMFDNCINFINKFKRKFDIIAKNNKNQICVIMPETKLDNAKFWAEKFRNEIAISILEIDNKKFNQTVSVGVSSINQASSTEEMLENANFALNHSIEKTNTVTTFN